MDWMWKIKEEIRVAFSFWVEQVVDDGDTYCDKGTLGECLFWESIIT